MRELALVLVFALTACAGNQTIYEEADNDLARCQALPEPGDRAACIQRLPAAERRVRDDAGVGPPACHPASTDRRDRDRC